MTTSSEPTSALAAQIAELALLRGTFTLRSGKTSSYYLDKYLFSTSPSVLDQVGDRFRERIEQIAGEEGAPIDRLAGDDDVTIWLSDGGSAVIGAPTSDRGALDRALWPREQQGDVSVRTRAEPLIAVQAPLAVLVARRELDAPDV